jgi:hypothetical protein
VVQLCWLLGVVVRTVSEGRNAYRWIKIDGLSFGWPFPPCKLSKLVLYFGLEMIKRRGTGACHPDLAC